MKRQQEFVKAPAVEAQRRQKKRLTVRSVVSSESSTEQDDGSEPEQWEVAAISDRRTKGNGLEYLILWADHQTEDGAPEWFWVDESTMGSPGDVLIDFNRRYEAKQQAAAKPATKKKAEAPGTPGSRQRIMTTYFNTDAEESTTEDGAGEEVVAGGALRGAGAELDGYTTPTGSTATTKTTAPRSRSQRGTPERPSYVKAPPGSGGSPAKKRAKAVEAAATPAETERIRVSPWPDKGRRTDRDGPGGSAEGEESGAGDRRHREDRERSRSPAGAGGERGQGRSRSGSESVDAEGDQDVT